MSDNHHQPLPEDLQDLERSLKGLNPEDLDPVSKGRLASAILHADSESPEESPRVPLETETRPTIGTRIKWGAWGSIAAAVSLAIGLNLGERPDKLPLESALTKNRDTPENVSTAQIPSDLSALETQSELKEVIDEGIILTESSRRMRQVRTLYTDTVSWVDPKTEARLEMSYLREELFLIPVDAI